MWWQYVNTVFCMVSVLAWWIVVLSSINKPVCASKLCFVQEVSTLFILMREIMSPLSLIWQCVLVDYSARVNHSFHTNFKYKISQYTWWRTADKLSKWGPTVSLCTQHLYHVYIAIVLIWVLFENWWMQTEGLCSPWYNILHTITHCILTFTFNGNGCVICKAIIIQFIVCYVINYNRVA